MLEAEPASFSQGVRAAQQQLAVRPAGVDQPPTAALVVAGEPLADRGQGVVGELDQVKRIMPTSA